MQISGKFQKAPQIIVVNGKRNTDQISLCLLYTSIGGIMGKIVSIKEETDSLVIETGIDRSKIRVKRWSVASCDTVHDTPES